MKRLWKCSGCSNANCKTMWLSYQPSPQNPDKSPSATACSDEVKPVSEDRLSVCQRSGPSSFCLLGRSDWCHEHCQDEWAFSNCSILCPRRCSSVCLSRFSSSPLPLPLLTLNMMWKDDFKSLPSSDRSEVCWWDIKTNTGEKKKVRREKRNKCILRVRAQGWDMSHSTLRNPLGSVESNTARLRTHTPSLLCSNFHPHGGSRTQTLESCTRPVGCTACHCGAPSDSSLTAWPNVI